MSASVKGAISLPSPEKKLDVARVGSDQTKTIIKRVFHVLFMVTYLNMFTCFHRENETVKPKQKNRKIIIAIFLVETKLSYYTTTTTVL